MCGITGIFTTRSFQHSELCAELTKQLHHRGPDFSYVLQLDEFCSVGHARLKIIDLSDNANQPMQCYQNRFVIVFNGEIYNFKQLKLELQRVSFHSKEKPYPFQTNSDTEVILAAYHRWGENCVQFLDGMFAFAIYDKFNKEIFLARDRMGKKSLYYYLNDNVFIFSSEIRPLLQSNLIPKKINTSQLYDYFQYHTNFSPHTLITDIQLIESSTSLKIALQNNKLKSEKKKYWKTIDKTYSTDNISYDEAKIKVRKLLFDAVEKRLISDVPLGAFLSGGIDSSAIVSILKQFYSNNVNTFHITTEKKEFSENQYAQSLAELYKTNHHNIILKEKEVLELVPEALEKMDYPSGDGINTYIVSKYTKQAGITVALSGIGGDELFAGYPSFKIMKKFQSLDFLDFPAIRKSVANFIPERFSYRLKILLQSPSLKVYELFPFHRKVFLEKKLPLKNSNKSTFFNAHLSEKKLIDNEHFLSFVSLLELDNYLQNVLLRDTDQMSMANALEVRAPFLDTALVNFVLALPDEYKYPTTPKKLLTDALSDLLPKDIIHRKKMGFVLPFKDWMRKELFEFCNQNIKDLSEHSFIDNAKLMSEWKKYTNNKNDKWWMFWHLIVLQNWISKNDIQVE
jgi:asparagine synthase (glutamine-hydrolysing)